MPIESPKLDERTARQLRDEMLALIPRYAPEWTDHNESDPGRTLIELFAWLGETLLYQFNRIPEKSYLEFLKLLGIEPAPAKPASAMLSFRPTGLDVVGVPRHTAVEAPGEGGAPVVFETDELLWATPHTLETVMVLEGATFRLRSGDNVVGPPSYGPFGVNATPGNALYLGFKGDVGFTADAELTLAVTVDAGQIPDTGHACPVLPVPREPAAELAWETWVPGFWRPLAVVSDETGAFTQSGSIRLRLSSAAIKTIFPPEPEERLWIRARVVTTGWTRPPRIDAIRVNTVAARQLATVREELCGSSDGTAGQTLKLRNFPVEEGSLILEVAEPDVWLPWTLVDTFERSGPLDPHYSFNPATGEVTFGDGRRGRVPLAGQANVRARVYRWGGGRRGNVAPETLRTVLGEVAPLVTAQNDEPATGGQDEETLDEAKRHARELLRGRDRAVTAEDFEYHARCAPGAGVRRAVALPLFHPSFPDVAAPGVVSVVVFPDLDEPAPMPTPLALRRVCEHLHTRRTLTTELYVLPPRYRTVRVDARAIVVPSHDPVEAARALRRAIDAYYHALTGGPEGTGWPLGYAVHAGEIYKVILDVPGIARVDRVSIWVDGERVPDGGNLALARNEVVAPGLHALVAEHDPA
jgi:predicted phage baseplate assembly protein